MNQIKISASLVLARRRRRRRENRATRLAANRIRDPFFRRRRQNGRSRPIIIVSASAHLEGQKSKRKQSMLGKFQPFEGTGYRKVFPNPNRTEMYLSNCETKIIHLYGPVENQTNPLFYFWYGNGFICVVECGGALHLQSIRARI